MTNYKKILFFLAISFSSANVLSKEYHFVINIGNSNSASEEVPIDEDAVLSWVNSNCGGQPEFGPPSTYSFSDYESLKNAFLQRNMIIQCQVSSVLPPILPEMNYPIMQINAGTVDGQPEEGGPEAGILSEFSFLSKTVKNSGFHYFAVYDFDYNGREIDHSALNGIRIGDPDSDPLAAEGDEELYPIFAFIFPGAGSVPDVKFTDSLGRANLAVSVNDNAGMLAVASLSDSYEFLSLISSNTISDVDALAGITSIDNLELQMEGITNINGLSNLTSSESMFVESTMLTDISGIRNISSVSLYILIENEESDFAVKAPFGSPFCLNYEDINIVKAIPFGQEKYTKEEVCETE
jgi:hypothetical protein